MGRVTPGSRGPFSFGQAPRFLSPRRPPCRAAGALVVAESLNSSQAPTLPVSLYLCDLIPIPSHKTKILSSLQPCFRKELDPLEEKQSTGTARFSPAPVQTVSCPPRAGRWHHSACQRAPGRLSLELGASPSEGVLVRPSTPAFSTQWAPTAPCHTDFWCVALSAP